MLFSHLLIMYSLFYTLILCVRSKRGSFKKTHTLAEWEPISVWMGCIGPHYCGRVYSILKTETNNLQPVIAYKYLPHSNTYTKRILTCSNLFFYCSFSALAVWHWSINFPVNLKTIDKNSIKSFFYGLERCFCRMKKSQPKFDYYHTWRNFYAIRIKFDQFWLFNLL